MHKIKHYLFALLSFFVDFLLFSLSGRYSTVRTVFTVFVYISLKYSMKMNFLCLKLSW